MKRSKHNRRLSFLTPVLIWLTAMTSGFANAKEIFAQLTEMPQVESTFISGKMGSRLMALPEVGRMVRNGIMLESGDFKAIFIYKCYSEESVKKARDILTDYIKSNKDVELLMRTRQGGQEYTMYEESRHGASNSSHRSKLIIWNSDAPNVCEVVVIELEELPDLSELTLTDDPLRYIQGIS